MIARRSGRSRIARVLLWILGALVYVTFCALPTVIFVMATNGAQP